jgi:plastocyanin
MLFVGVLAITGCGSSSNSTSSSASTPPASSTPAGAAPAPATSSAASAPTQAPANGAGQTQTLAANPEGQLKYNKTALTAKAGKVSIDFTNMSPEDHNMTVASASGAVLGATPTFQGGSKTLTLNLKPGTYKFFCTVPGHRTAGMEGTLTVQ